MSIPAFLSGMNDLDFEVFITDRDNEMRIPLDAVDFLNPDWDIDRPGSKARLSVGTYKRTLVDGMWLAPYQVITPETGEISNRQMGHFWIETPSARFDDSIGYDGERKIIQEAAGSDIVDMLAKARLSETFYTPVGGDPMEDVRVLLKMASCGFMGSNRLQNGGFEQEATGWAIVGGVAYSAGGSGTSAWKTVAGHPEGEKAWVQVFSPGQPVNALAYNYQSVSLPASAVKLYVSGLHYTGANISMWISARFYDANGEQIVPSRIDTWIDGKAVTPSRWVRQFAVGDVPAGATTVRVYIFARDLIGGRSTSVGTYWDDIRIGTCTTDPIPDNRINLPPSSSVATTRIQSTAGSSFIYDAVNSDRLGPIGHHAIYTDLDGVLKTSPSRVLATATPKRRYGREDHRIVGDIQTERSANNRYNHFMAIKEDFENPSASLIAQSYNNNPQDPWSVHNMALTSAPPIMMPDAVNLAALQAAAHAARDRASEQEMLRIQVIPDSDLAVHDVIEILDSDLPEAVGKWSVEYIRPGMRPEDPLTEIAARRNRNSQGVI